MVQDKNAHFSYKLVPSMDSKGVMTHKKIVLNKTEKTAANKPVATTVINKTVINKTVINNAPKKEETKKVASKEVVKKTAVKEVVETKNPPMPGWLGFLLAVLILGAIIGLAFVLGKFL